MDASEILNTPLEMRIGGRALKVRKPSIRFIFAELSQQLRAEMIADGFTVAEKLSGEERVKFLADMFERIPRGIALQRQVWERANSPEGVASLLWEAVRHDNKITQIELDSLVSEDQQGAFAWVMYLFGVEKKAPAAEMNPPQKNGK